MHAIIPSVALAVLLLFQAALVQSNPNVDPQFVAQLVDAPTRLARNKLFNDSDYIFDFLSLGAGQPGVTTGLDGHTIGASVLNMPALQGENVAITLGFVGPCGINTPHTHPRAAEFNYVVNGSFTTGMFAENGARVVLGNVTTGQASLFPRGAIHFEANLECTPSFFVAAFGDEDPAVMQIAQALFGLPPQINAATLGRDLTATQVSVLKEIIPANVAFGLQSCVQRCGLTVTKEGCESVADLLVADINATLAATTASGSNRTSEKFLQEAVEGQTGLPTDPEALSTMRSGYRSVYFGVGIGVGAAAVVLLGLLGSLVFWAVRRHKPAGRRHEGLYQVEPPHDNDPFVASQAEKKMYADDADEPLMP